MFGRGESHLLRELEQLREQVEQLERVNRRLEHELRECREEHGAHYPRTVAMDVRSV